MKNTVNGGRDRLNRLLRITNVSAYELANLADTNDPNIYMFLSGKRNGFTPATWDAFAQVFGVPVEWLMFGRGPTPDDADVLRAVARRRDVAA